MLEVPTFTSKSKLLFKVADTGKTLMQATLNESDNLGIRELMDRSIGVIESDTFREELATVLKSDMSTERLVLAWSISSRMRVQYALSRLGLGGVEHEPIRLKSLSKEEIAALLGKMISVGADYKEQTAEVRLTSLDPRTAERLNNVVVKAFIQTNSKIKESDLGKSLDFLDKQKEGARRKLVETNDNLRLFYQENPELLNANSKSNPIDERGEIMARRSQLLEDIESNRKLLEFYKSKYANFSKNSDTTAEVYNKFKQELIELKYKRKKYIFQGYDEKNDGIVEIDKKIAEIERILSSSKLQGDLSEGRLVGVGHEQSLSDKIMELQDTIKKEQFEVEGLKGRLEKASTKSESLSHSMLLLENLKVDVRLATNVFEEMSKKVEYAQMRKDGDDQQILVKESASLPTRSNNIPLSLRVFFAFFVGVALAISWLIFSSLLSFRITDSQNVESLGIRFAGVLSEFDPELSQVLMNLDCLDTPEGAETPVVLCTSPQQSVTHEELQLLTNFLARQGEKSLFILVGSTRLHPKFQLVSDIGFAKVYSHPNEMEFVLVIYDKETIKSLRECIKILEETYQLKYGCVFLYFENGILDPNYHVGLKVASQVLMLGAPARYTSADYYKLVYGLKNLKDAKFAFAEVRRRRRGPTARIPTGAPDVAGFPQHPPSFLDKVKGTFFDL